MVDCELQDVGLFQFALSNLCEEKCLLLEYTHDLQAHLLFQMLKVVLRFMSYSLCTYAGAVVVLQKRF